MRGDALGKMNDVGEETGRHEGLKAKRLGESRARGQASRMRPTCPKRSPDIQRGPQRTVHDEPPTVAGAEAGVNPK